MGLKKQIWKIKNILEFHYLEAKRQKLLEKLPNQKKIKIAFLGYALGASCDVFSKIYKEFKNDDRFLPYMVIVPNPYGSKEIMVEVQNQAKQYLDGLNIPYICGYNEDNDTYVDIIKTLNPDIVFMCHHYDWFPKEFRADSFKEKLVYITPYSYILTNNYIAGANMDAFIFSHKCFFEAAELSSLWKNASAVKKNKKGKFLGYLKVDNILFSQNYHKDVWKIKDKAVKRIIWAPHHLDAPLSNFLEYKDLFLSFAQNRTDIQFAFRPHPGLKGSLQRIAGWDEKKINEYYQSWQSLPNAFISEGDFADLFLSSDAMILDSVSFIAEYFLTGKPALIQTPKQNDFPFNDFCKKLKEANYKSKDWNDILNFINEIVIKGNDTKKKDRLDILKRDFMPDNKQPAYKNIYNYICDEIFKKIQE